MAIIRSKREFKENVAAKLRQEIYNFWLNLGKDFGFFERWQQEMPTQQDARWICLRSSQFDPGVTASIAPT